LWDTIHVLNIVVQCEIQHVTWNFTENFLRFSFHDAHTVPCPVKVKVVFEIARKNEVYRALTLEKKGESLDDLPFVPKYLLMSINHYRFIVVVVINNSLPPVDNFKQFFAVRTNIDMLGWARYRIPRVGSDLIFCEVL
jgi:hypothetical protein